MGNDFALVIGWPDAYCKQPGFWFDPIGRILGMNRNGFYKVGHSAIVLIDVKNKKCEYFDFGRYHAPFKKGRVRDQVKDPLLKIKTIPIFSEDQQSILNVDQILEPPLALHATIYELNFHLSKTTEKEIAPNKIQETN